MKRSFNSRIRRLKSNRSYSTADLAKFLEVHVRTVQAWHKAGLTPNNPNERPLLYRGDVVKVFHAEKREKSRHELKPGELYCLRCHAPRMPKQGSVRHELTDRRIGKIALQVKIRANCEVCNCPMNLMTTDKCLERQRESMKLEKHQRGLECEQLGFVFTDLKAR